MSQLLDQIEMTHLRILQYFGHVVQRNDWDVVGFQPLQPLGPASCQKHRRQRRFQRFVILPAGVPRLKSRVFREIHTVGRLEQSEPKLFRHRAMNRYRQLVLAYKGKCVGIFHSGHTIRNRTGSHVTRSRLADKG
jgi:hypothetical protein